MQHFSTRGGARNPKIPTIFKVAKMDSGVIKWINADQVTHSAQRVWIEIPPVKPSKDL